MIQMLVIQIREMMEMPMTIAGIVEIHLIHRMIVETAVMEMEETRINAILWPHN
jgi:hypothetical protein